MTSTAVKVLVTDPMRNGVSSVAGLTGSRRAAPTWTEWISRPSRTIPAETLEAAKIDGAGRFRILVSIVVPLMRPTIMVLATFFFIWTWNEFFIPLVLLPGGAQQTVSVALGGLFGQYTSNPVTTAAAATLGILPTVVFFLIFQRTLMQGVNIGSVK